MGKKKKCKPVDKFMTNRSPSAKAHPCYVFSEDENRYQSFGISHEPNKKHQCIKLSRNPEVGSSAEAYISAHPLRDKKRYYCETSKRFEFAPEDKPVVKSMARHNRKKKK